MHKLILLAAMAALVISCSSYSSYDPTKTSGYIVVSGKLLSNMYFTDPIFGTYLEIHDSRIQGEDAVELYVSTDQSNWLKIDTVAVTKTNGVMNSGTIIVSDGYISMLDINGALIGRYFKLWVFNYNARQNTAQGK
ncbi:MAG: hypothetical protein AABZ39_04845 [Spirochaetota bacterium]